MEGCYIIQDYRPRRNREMNMSQHKIMLEIPDGLYQRLQHFAHLGGNPFEKLVLQTLSAGIPPLPEDLPPEMQSELLKLESFVKQQLWEIARNTISEKQQLRYNQLLKKQRDDDLSHLEQEELEQLFIQAENNMLRKAYAYALLKWRGQRLPPLSQLPPITQ